MIDKPSKLRSAGKLENRSNKHKHQKIQQSNEPGEDEDGDNGDYNDDNSIISNTGVRKPVDDRASNLGVNDNNESIDETEEADKPPTNSIVSNLDGPY